jgi:hypothetical protein
MIDCSENYQGGFRVAYLISQAIDTVEIIVQEDLAITAER